MIWCVRGMLRSTRSRFHFTDVLIRCFSRQILRRHAFVDVGCNSTTSTSTPSTSTIGPNMLIYKRSVHPAQHDQPQLPGGLNSMQSTMVETNTSSQEHRCHTAPASLPSSEGRASRQGISLNTFTLVSFEQEFSDCQHLFLTSVQQCSHPKHPPQPEVRTDRCIASILTLCRS
jgi:hypothetical protein